MSEFYGPHYHQEDAQIRVVENLYHHYNDDAGRTEDALVTLGWTQNEAAHAVRDMLDYWNA